jgi:hypothetical protein
MPLSEYIPFRNIDNFPKNNFVAKTISGDDVKMVAKTMKVAALALGYQGTNYFYTGRGNFEPAPYDFDRIIQAIDTDSYIKQAIGKYKELFWKEGWQIVGENPDAVAYLYQRIDFMEMAMKRPFVDFLIEVSDQLFKFCNAFIVKARGDIGEYFPSNLTPVSATQPIVGYYLIPTEQVRILRDKYNRPKSYQQATDPLTYSPTDRDPVWSAERVIHMFFDRKTGRAFGTPFLSTVLDDIVALRQIEEDIQNLVHRELFPIYKYRIGTQEQPAEPDEIENAAVEIENLRAEGGLILPYRHDIEVIGSQDAALNASPYLEHFKERVAVGLGLAPHHLGMNMNGGNRSVTDRLDTALYDKVKQYQKLFAEMVRVHIFNELLFEGGFDPVANPMNEGISDRCYFKFNEIDVDTQVKKETHIVQKYTNSVTTLSETRIALGLEAEIDESELFAAIQGKVQIEISKAQAENAASMQDNAQNQKVDQNNDNSDKQNSAQKGQVNLPNKRKGPGNVVRPANQNGRKTSPDIRRSDLSWLGVVENLLESDYNVVYTDEQKDFNDGNRI